MTDHYETIVVARQDGVGVITFNRPEKRNAMNPRLHEEMNLALDGLVEDEAVRVIILTGAGDSFCAGNDLKEFFADQIDRPARFRRNSRRFTQWREKLRTCPKPTIAAINGWCLGAGLSVICVADFALAAEEAMFGLPEINFGVFPAGGATKGPLTLLSHRDAMDLILTGRNISAQEAERLRLVNRCVPRDRLMTECLALADELKQKDPVALMIAKEAVWLVRLQEYPDALEVEAGKHRELHFLQQGRWVSAGIGRFLEKRYKPTETSYLNVPDEPDPPQKA
jgi:trans-feruloyl-CoA hydratase/vanillin synthase